MAVAITRTADPAGVSASSNVATYSSVSIGTASDDRIVVLCFGGEYTLAGTLSATIDYGSGDVAMNNLSGSSLGSMVSRIFWLPVPSGTTATFKVTTGTANPTNVQNHITVYSVTGAYPSCTGNAHSSTDMDATTPLIANYGTGSTSAKLDILSGCGFIACAACADDTTTKTWTGATADLDEDAGDFRWNTATQTSTQSANIRCTGSLNGEDGALTWIMFYPKNDAFGDMKGGGGGIIASTAGTNVPATNRVYLKAGDLVIVNYSENSLQSTTGCSDNLGNTYTQLDSSGVAISTYYCFVTVEGNALIQVAQTAAGAAGAGLCIAVFNGPFHPLVRDKTVGYIGPDSAEPYDGPASGTLAQPNELLVGYWGSSAETSFDTPSGSSKLNIQNCFTAGAQNTAITSLVVNSTSTVTLSLSGANGATSTVMGLSCFRKAWPGQVLMARTANPAGASSSGNNVTYASQSIGPPGENRVVALLVSSEDVDAQPVSATIDYGSGAVAMRATARATFTDVGAIIFYLYAPTGTTATFVVTFTNTTTNIENHASVYTVYGSGMAPTQSGTSISTDMDSTAPLTTGAITFSVNAGFIAVASGATDTVAKTWANATKDLDVDAGNFRYTTATRQASALSATAVTCTGTTNLEDGAMAWAVFDVPPVPPGLEVLQSVNRSAYI